MESTKQKIDKLLGIQDDSSIDDFLNDLTKDNQTVSASMSEITSEIKEDLQKVDEQLGLVSDNGSNSILVLSDIEKSMKEVEELISLSKLMFKHIYENIVSSELCDSELIGSTAKMLEAIHINISEFINLYKDKERFIEKIKIMAYQQQQKIQLMDYKHKLDLEKIQLAKKEKQDNVIDATEGSFTMSQEKITKLLDQLN